MMPATRLPPRAVEYRHLGSQEFADACEQAGVELGRFRH
jgi:hypothetical protein